MKKVQAKVIMSRVKFFIKTSILSLLISIFSSQITVAQAVSIDSVDGLISGARLQTNQLITFNIRFNNNSGSNIGGFTTSFHVYSPDGATWTSTVGDSTGALTSAHMGGGRYIKYRSPTGSGADTISFSGFDIFAPGLPDGFNEVSYTVQIGPIENSDGGKTICIDSVSYPQNQWKWVSAGSPDLFPAWDGPHCFTVCGGGVDTDGDLVADDCDNCPDIANADQNDVDDDGIGDVCDDCTDTDGDGFGDPGFAANTCPVDNCPTFANPSQEDADADGIGDVCDECTDIDGDGFGDPGFPANTCNVDNCPDISNPWPLNGDSDNDGIGNSCDDCTDTDGDGYGDPGFINNTCTEDNCPTTVNPGQEDSDLDGLGDACCCVGIRGNLDDDVFNFITISDLVFMVDYIFTRGAAPFCPNEANVNGDSEGDIDISDLVALVDYIFTGSPRPADCP